MLSSFEDVAESLLAIPKRDRAAVWKRALPRAERLKAKGVGYPERLFRALDEAIKRCKPKTARRQPSWIPLLDEPPAGCTWRSAAAELLGDHEDEGLLRAGAVLLAAAHVGPVNEKVAAATGVPIDDVLNFGFRLRSVNIWERGKVNYPWLELIAGGEPGGMIGFVAHCMLAVGDGVMDEHGRFRLAVLGEGNDGRSHCNPGEDLTGAMRLRDMRLERQVRAAHHANRKQLV